VYVGTVVNSENNDSALLLVDLIKHPVRTAPGRPDSGRFAPQRLAHPPRRNE